MRKYLGALVLCFGLAAGAIAQTAWPERPVKLVIGSSPGGSNDFVGRTLGDLLARVLGQPVVIDNRPGAGARIGTDVAVKAPPDGYTLTVGSPGPIAVNPVLDPKWATAHTLVPVVKVSTSPLVIAVSPQLGVKSVRELIDYAKKNPGKLNFAHPGQGTPPHLAGILFNQLTGTNLVAVPFRSGGEAVTSVIAGDTQVIFATPPSVLPFFKSGRMIGLATTTTDRFSLTPDLSGMKEAGLPAYKMDFWYGLFAPQGTPPEIVKKLFDATTTVLQKPEYKAALATGGMEASSSASSAEFVAFLREEVRFWEKLAKASGAKVE